MKAMLFAAGKGTRLKPITDIMPKALVPVCGKPLLEHVLEKLSASGFNDIVINVHHFASQIYDYVNERNSCAASKEHQGAVRGSMWDNGVKISFSNETDELLETGGGIKKAEPLLNNGEPFLVHNVDIFTNLDLMDIYNAHLEFSRNQEVRKSASDELCPERELVATVLVSERKTSRYLLFDENDYLVGWTNLDTGELRSPYKNLKYPSPGIRKYAFGCVHVMSPSIFKYMETFPKAFPIMDFYLAVCAECRIKAYVKNNLEMIDVGKLDSLEAAESFLAHHM